MIKFIRSNIVIIIGVLIVLTSGFFAINQSGYAHAIEREDADPQAAEPVDYVSPLSPDKQVASYAYYKALEFCVNSTQEKVGFNTSVTENDVNSIFKGNELAVNAGIIARTIATTNGVGNLHNDDPNMWCETIAKAAFSLWGFSSNSEAVMGKLGYKQSQVYKCQYVLAVDTGNTDIQYYAENEVLGAIFLPLNTEDKSKTNYPYIISTGVVGKVDTPAQLNDYCDYIIYEVITNNTRPPNTVFIEVGATTKQLYPNMPSYAESTSTSSAWATDTATFPKRFLDYIKTNIYAGKEPSLDDIPGIKYYIAKFYFQNKDTCGAINKGEAANIVNGNTTTNYSDEMVTAIKNPNDSTNAYGPYVEVNIVTSSVGALTKYGFNMEGPLAKRIENAVTLWTGVASSCKGIAAMLGSNAQTIQNGANQLPKIDYSKIIDASGGAGTPPTGSGGTDNPPEKQTCGSQLTGGMGWLMCPVITGLANLNDAIWGVVSGLLTINPLSQTDSNGVTGVYKAWGTIRNIANVAFVIVFLVMIFSQLSSAGISNYGIKKLLPRLVIGAILVNISFLLIQIAIDLSNVVGSSLYDLLVSIIPAWHPDFISMVEQISIVQGAAAGAAATALVVSATIGITPALWLLLPVLAMAVLGLLAALLTLIFRKAAIIVLAILAPLAIVASLLPNTESWYKSGKMNLYKC